MYEYGKFQKAKTQQIGKIVQFFLQIYPVKTK